MRIELGKKMMSGLLSMTTAALLVPVAPARATQGDASLDEMPGREETPGDEGTAPKLLGSARMGDRELVDGTPEEPARYDDARFRAAFSSEGIGEDGVTLDVDGCRCVTNVHRRPDRETEYEIEATIPDGLWKRVSLTIEDVSGRVSVSIWDFVVVDTLPPVYRARWAGGQMEPADDGSVYICAAARLLVTVEEPNPSDDLGLYVNGVRQPYVSDGNERFFEVEFARDGAYELLLQGTDMLGRELERAPEGIELPRRVVVDTQAPVARVCFDGLPIEDADLFEGVFYATELPRVSIEISEEHLDVTTLRVGGASGVWMLQDGLWRLDLPDDTCLDQPLVLEGADRAGNQLSGMLRIPPVIVDVAAPTVDVAQVEPDAVVDVDDRVELFFNRQAELRLDVRDDKGLKEIRVEPADVCEVDGADVEPGTATAQVGLRLREGIALGEEVRVTAVDLAGNWRTWSVAPEGVVCERGAERTTLNESPYVDDRGMARHPLAMLLDMTAPTLEIVGVEDGAAYDGPQEVRVRVKESSFAYLKSHGGEAFADQVVLTAMSGAQEHEAEPAALLRVRDFQRDALTDTWEAAILLKEDDTYVLRARLVDPALNASSVTERCVTIDTTAPQCDVSFVRDEAHPEAHEGAFFRGGRKARVRVRERNWSRIRSLSLRYETEDGRTTAVSPDRFVAREDDWYECEVPFEDDGAYRLLLDAVDVAGNEMAPYVSDRFVVDTISPSIDVSYEGGKRRDGLYCKEPLVATIRVLEHNWGDDGRYVVEVTKTEGAKLGLPEVTRWQVEDASHPDVHVCRVAFGSSGRYSLRVRGTDLAGHAARCGEREGFSDEFVIDLDAPEVHVGFSPSSYAEFAGVKYLNHAIEVPLVVRDRNLDADATAVVWDGRGLSGDRRIGWDVSAPLEDGMVERRRVLQFGHGRHVSPSVAARDLAGNERQVDGEAFVVDLKAPVITAVSTTTSPAASYDVADGDREAPMQFFDQVTQLVFEVEDEFLIDSVSLYDPDGQYELAEAVERGDARGRVVVDLVENAQSHAGEAFERNIVLSVTDVAGNRRTWTLDQAGHAVADVVEEDGSAPLNGEGVLPFALVQDTTAPALSVEGVSAGVVTNQTLVANVDIHEHNFSFLRAFRPQDVVVRVMSKDATPGRVPRTEEIRASQFEGEDPTWMYAREFSSDGHYAMEASVTDVAGHRSNRVEVGEFCIDKTPPSIDVSWDHDVNEAHFRDHMHYFATTRHATVTVQEHNFRPQDVVIDAGSDGRVGAWEDAGDDRYVCHVDYDHEAKGCQLLVYARDEAGNEARPYEQRSFTIDLTPPRVRVDNVVGPQGERAFAGDVEPVISFDDGEHGNFDDSSQGWDYEIRGLRRENSARRGDVMRFRQEEHSAQGGAEVRFADFGTSSDEQAYDIGFDDIYTLTARVRDLAGNEGEPLSVTFSVNRFGSNFFVEETEGLEAQFGADGSRQATRPIMEPPRIVVHEVNVSGAMSELDHRVTREYANAPEELRQDRPTDRPRDDDAGYSLASSRGASAYNEYAGWSEYVYTIRSGNFGEGAIEGSDGQGLYRVNVSSVDAAQNANSTSRYWGSDASRGNAKDKSATVTFTLDELAPVIDALDTGTPLVVGGSHTVAFHVTDDISCGDTVEVLVNGQPVEVRSHGLERRVDDAGVSTGTYSFEVMARPFVPQDVTVRVTDYAGRSATRDATVYVTTLLAEGAIAAVLIGLGLVALGLARRRRALRDPEYPIAA